MASRRSSGSDPASNLHRLSKLRETDRASDPAQTHLQLDPATTAAQSHAGRSAHIPQPGETRGPSGMIIQLSFVMLWMVVALALLARLALESAVVRRLVAGCRPLSDDRWNGLVSELQARLRVRRPVRLLECDETIVPVTCRLVRPVILLPAASRDWSLARGNMRPSCTNWHTSSGTTFSFRSLRASRLQRFVVQPIIASRAQAATGRRRAGLTTTRSSWRKPGGLRRSARRNHRMCRRSRLLRRRHRDGPLPRLPKSAWPFWMRTVTASPPRPRTSQPAGSSPVRVLAAIIAATLSNLLAALLSLICGAAAGRHDTKSPRRRLCRKRKAVYPAAPRTPGSPPVAWPIPRTSRSPALQV